MKTENSQDVGKHAFELAGLGRAPFRFVGMSENAYRLPDGSSKAGGSCDFCGTAIRWECRVQSADGNFFKVGCDCIAKVDDSGLMKAYKTSPEYRTKQRVLREAKAKVVRVEFIEFIKQNEARLSLHKHPGGYIDWETRLPWTALDYARWQLNNCGDSGKRSALKYLRGLLGLLGDARYPDPASGLH